MLNAHGLALIFANGADYTALQPLRYERGEQKPMDEGTVDSPTKVPPGYQAPSDRAIYLLKDTARVGKFKHPVHKWVLPVSRERMDGWTANFAKMKANGTKVAVYADHKPGANNLLGYVEDAFSGGDPDAFARWPCLYALPKDAQPWDPDRLYTIQKFTDPACAAVAQRVNQVSALVDEDFKDGETSYGDAIRHVAVTPEPVIGDQEEYQLLAASLQEAWHETGAVCVYTLDRSDSSGDQSKEPSTMAQLSDEQIVKIAKLLKEHAQEEIDAKNPGEGLCRGLAKICEDNAAMKGRLTGATKAADRITALEAENAQVKTDLAAANQKALSSITVDPDVLDQLVEGTQFQLSTLVEQARITPAVKDKLEAILVGPEKARNAYALSRNVSKTEKSIASSIIAALKENDPVVLGEKSRAQLKELSRETPGEDGVKPEEQKAVTEEMIDMVGGAKPTKK
jgi:hypothetical protein